MVVIFYDMIEKPGSLHGLISQFSVILFILPFHLDNALKRVSVTNLGLKSDIKCHFNGQEGNMMQSDFAVWGSPRATDAKAKIAPVDFAAPEFDVVIRDKKEQKSLPLTTFLG
ncbi:hypothetical protein Tco_0077478 [Tanacetum coccineum]